MKTIKRIFSVLVIKPLEFIQRYFKTFVFIFIAIMVVNSMSPQKNMDANLAKIYLKGPIFESETFASQIENLSNFPNVKGVLLIIDSPGGGLAQSIEIADMIRELQETMPIVSYVQGAMASGSYYAGMYADVIVANRGSMIGSIGVILNGYNIKELMDKMGIKSQGISAGEFKEAGTITREWTNNEKEYLSNLINKQYKMFINDVANARNINPNQYKTFAEGKVFNAEDALNIGLIDVIGSQTHAVNLLKKLSGVEKAVWTKSGLIDSYIDKITSKILSNVFVNVMKLQ